MLREPLVVRTAGSKDRNTALARRLGAGHFIQDLVDDLHRHSACQMMLADGGEQDERPTPCRVIRRQDRGDQRSIGETDDRRLVGFRRIEYGQRVFDLRFHIRQLVERDRIRQAGSSAIEMDEPPERAEAAQETGEIREVPHGLDVMEPGVDQKNIELSGPNRLEGDMDIAVSSKPRLRCLGHFSDSRVIPSCYWC